MVDYIAAQISRVYRADYSQIARYIEIGPLPNWVLFVISNSYLLSNSYLISNFILFFLHEFVLMFNLRVYITFCQNKKNYSAMLKPLK